MTTLKITTQVNIKDNIISFLVYNFFYDLKKYTHRALITNLC